MKTLHPSRPSARLRRLTPLLLLAPLPALAQAMPEAAREN